MIDALWYFLISEAVRTKQKVVTDIIEITLESSIFWIYILERFIKEFRLPRLSIRDITQPNLKYKISKLPDLPLEMD